MLPALVLLFLVTILPTLFLLGTGLTNLNPSRPNSLQFIGLQNFVMLLQDGRFWNSIWVQVRLSFWTVTLQILIGLGMALLLNSRLRFLELVRSVFIIPMVLPPVIVAIIWKILFTSRTSARSTGRCRWSDPGPAWLVHPLLRALFAISSRRRGSGSPFTMLLLLAALQMMPDEPLEAARIDGPSGLQVFRYIVLPLLKNRPSSSPCCSELIDSVKAFPHIFIMTGGAGRRVPSQRTSTLTCKDSRSR